MNCIEISNLTIRYGSDDVVDALNLEISEGEVFGLLGPNGAGKSSTIKAMLGLLKPYKGSIRMYGEDTASLGNKIGSFVGYVPQDLVFYNHLSVLENLKLFASLQKLIDPRDRINEVAEIMQLTPFLRKRANQLSGGQKRRLSVAIGLLHAPKILVLDEPSAGMDPQSRNLLWETIQHLTSKTGTTIIIATHLMETADRLCSRIVILDEGKVLADGTPEELKSLAKTEKRAEVSFVDSKSAVVAANKIEARSEIDGRTLTIPLSTPEEVRTLTTQLLEEMGRKITSFLVTTASLEDVFIQLTGKQLREADSA